MKRLWITGYRSYELGVFSPKDPKITVIKYCLNRKLKQLLEDGELDWVISGPNLGVEQWALEEAIELQKDYPIHTSLMAPYQEFSKRWNEENQARLYNLQEQVDFYGATSNRPYQSPVQLRNYQNFMIEHTDSALMIYDPEKPGKPKYDYELILKYQEQKDYDLDLIDFYSLQDAANEYEENRRYQN
ncbi:DUF1273 domain-containing protein [Lactobacillus psittaci]|uniref:UPF0398 protein FC23_GL000497 n=1 Tax=Lactobacillus psittaci DSM 15354 TaxID=1122152 RepID=A0A0R1SB55_9LACO|nr:DUF1273 domain-containing protein [Lactobacillus psittaci]KRL63589.1 hypothetical protein FC23_GL000497 [Lactobacillus psittaci DSM 15354]